MEDNSLESRLSKVEAAFEHTVTVLAKLDDHVDGIYRMLRERDRAPWANLIAGGALIIAIVALGARGWVRDIERIDRALLHRYSENDPVQDAQIKQLIENQTTLGEIVRAFQLSNSSQDAKQTEQIRGLERKVFKTHEHTKREIIDLQ